MHIWIVTSEKYFNIVREQLPDVKEEQILLEPCLRNTAPCLAYVSWKIKKNNPDANIVVSPADHIVIDTAEFDRIIKQGLEFIGKDNRILTLGIMPNRSETGYGYIKTGNDISANSPVKVEAFKEKPDLQTAMEYIRAGGYYWNAGIFFWNIDTIMNAFRKYTPDLAGIFDRLDNYLYTKNEQEKVNELFPECRKISVDYAIMENANNVYVLPCSFGWSDLGTWGSLHKQLVHDERNNAFNGDRVKMIESSNCVVSVPENKKVVEIDGRKFLFEKPLNADVAIIYGTKVDKFGNIFLEGTTRNFNQIMATAAKTVIVEADEIVDSLDPNMVTIPGIFVDYIVAA